MSTLRKASEIPPGWVDLQVNGYAGIDFSQAGLTVDDVRRATEILVARGTAAYCPTMVTSESWVYEANIPVLTAALNEPDLAPHLLGLHLEGPFLSTVARGAHKASLLQPPSVAKFDHWQKLAQGRIILLTLAPEQEEAEALIEHAVARDVAVSLGHHVGDTASIDRAVRAGATLCTHLGNGIPNTLPRHPNPIWAQLADDRLTAMLITDGHHLPPDFVKTALRTKGLDKIIMTSDAASIAGLPPGTYRFAGTEVISEPGGRVSVKGSDSLAGSSATMEECARWLRGRALVSESDLVRIGRINPLRAIGIV